MGSRTNASTDSHLRGRETTAKVLSELRSARRDRNVSGAAVAAMLGLSPAQYSRMERGLTAAVSIEDAVVALAAVGLRLTVGIYPAGPPLRDAAHAALIGRFRAICHSSIRLLDEVPLPMPGDLRAWDLVAMGPSWRHAFEFETRPRDRQAIERRIALKARDGGISGVSLVLLDSRHNRDFVRLHQRELHERFPVPAAVSLAAIRAGHDPGEGSVILL